MMKIKIKKIRLTKLLYSIGQYLMIIPIVLSNTIWVRAYEIPVDQGMLTLMFTLFAFLLFVLNIVKNGKPKIRYSLMKPLLAVMALSLCSTIALRDSRVTFFLYYVIPLLLCILYLGLEKNVEGFWRKFSNVVFVICVVSLVFYIMASLLKIIPPTGMTKYKWTWDFQCKNWFNLYYEAYYGNTSIASFLPRKNMGLYTEPPMFVIMVCIAMAGELSFVEIPRKKYIIVFIVTIFSTMSTTGYLFIIMSIVIFIFNIDRGKRSSAIKMIVFSLIILMAAFVIIEIMNQKMGTEIGENSVNIRLDHLLTSFSLWAENPIFGIGYGQIDLFEQSSSYQQGASVGLPLFLAYSGICGFSVYFIPFIRAMFLSLKDNHRYLYFVVGSFLLLFLTSVNYLPIMILIIAVQIACIEGKSKRIHYDKIS